MSMSDTVVGGLGGGLLWACCEDNDLSMQAPVTFLWPLRALPYCLCFSFPASQRVFPYISAMVNNGSLSYDHERDGRTTELGGCTAIVRNLHYDTFLVIRYVKRHLTVSSGSGSISCIGCLVAALWPGSDLSLFLF